MDLTPWVAFVLPPFGILALMVGVTIVEMLRQ
jgi:hypothetical protein